MNGVFGKGSAFFPQDGGGSQHAGSLQGGVAQGDGFALQTAGEHTDGGGTLGRKMGAEAPCQINGGNLFGCDACPGKQAFDPCADGGFGQLQSTDILCPVHHRVNGCFGWFTGLPVISLEPFAYILLAGTDFFFLFLNGLIQCRGFFKADFQFSFTLKCLLLEISYAVKQ